ncbi:MAG: site-2 protease family protein [Clostridia bacterium]|nr:site-2 protease family protein [Clostridia bacterium]
MWFLKNDITFEYLLAGIFAIISIIFVVFPIKQYVYALTADKLGDDMPRLMGKLTLNPIVHFDLLGAVIFMLFGMGWPKGVLINYSNLKNKRRDLFLIGITSPLVHLAFAIFCAVIFKILRFVLPIESQSILFLFVSLFIYFNVMFTVYEFLPIEPFKGFYIFQSIMSERVFSWYAKNYRMISLGFCVLLLFGFFNGILQFLQGIIYYLIIIPFMM